MHGSVLDCAHGHQENQEETDQVEEADKVKTRCQRASQKGFRKEEVCPEKIESEN